MKVRSETVPKQRKWPLLWQGIVASPLATLGIALVAMLLLGIVPGHPGLGLLVVLGLAGWHIADFVTAFFDKRRRLLHDILFHTRLQYVTYRD